MEPVLADVADEVIEAVESLNHCFAKIIIIFGTIFCLLTKPFSLLLYGSFAFIW